MQYVVLILLLDEGDDFKEDPSKEVNGLPFPDCDRQEVLETPIRLLQNDYMVLRRESRTSPPNVFVRHIKTGEEIQITHIEHPQPELLGVSKQLINYERDDGTKLSAYLFLPPGYDKGKLSKFAYIFYIFVQTCFVYHQM